MIPGVLIKESTWIVDDEVLCRDIDFNWFIQRGLSAGVFALVSRDDEFCTTEYRWLI